MPAHKRTKAQRQADLSRIADLWCTGTSQSAIAQSIGVTQQQVSHDLKEVRRLWSESSRSALAEIKGCLLNEIRLNKSEMRRAWKRSQATKETTTQKQVKTPAVGNGEDAKVEPEKERVEASLKQEGRDGDVGYMREVREYIELECKIHGIFSPERHEHSGPDRQPIQFIEVVRPATVPSPAIQTGQLNTVPADPPTQMPTDDLGLQFS